MRYDSLEMIEVRVESIRTDLNSYYHSAACELNYHNSGTRNTGK